MPIHFWPNGADIAAFLIAFWPEAAATGLGVALGLPAARSIEAWRHRKERAEREADGNRRRSEAAKVLVTSLLMNSTNAAQTAALVGDSALLDIALDVSAWDVVRDDVLQFFSEAELRADIAGQYERLRAFIRVVRLHREYAVGVQSALHNTSKMQAKLTQIALMRAGVIVDKSLPILDRLLSIAGMEEGDVSQELQQLQDSVAALKGHPGFATE